MNDVEARYQQSLEYLYGFVDYSLLHVTALAAAHFDLSRIQALAAALGNPQLRYPMIHVAGTKGKGSIAAFCASVLKAAGYRVGLYTSPHLFDYAERIQVDGRFISHAALADLVDEVRPVVAGIPRLTTFEITTALAWLYFARQGVTAAVIEVGLGGRLDATNIITPLVSVISSISYDHTQVLGDTLQEIATEKAGIIKPGVPVVVSAQEEEARQAIAAIAEQRGSRLVQVGVDYRFAADTHSLSGQSFRIWEAEAAEPVTLTIPLLGAHQVTNAATAYAALRLAAQHRLPVSEAAMQQGFQDVIWPGRFEVIQQDPPVVLDCAHNRDSALKLRQALQGYFPGKAVVLVFGASEDKDIHGMLEELLPGARLLLAVKSFHPRAIEPARLVNMAAAYDCPSRAAESIQAAIPEALREAGTDGLVLVTGSIFVVAEARKLWKEDNQE